MNFKFSVMEHRSTLVTVRDNFNYVLLKQVCKFYNCPFRHQYDERSGAKIYRIYSPNRFKAEADYLKFRK